MGVRDSFDEFKGPLKRGGGGAAAAMAACSTGGRWRSRTALGLNRWPTEHGCPLSTGFPSVSLAEAHPRPTWGSFEAVHRLVKKWRTSSPPPEPTVQALHVALFWSFSRFFNGGDRTGYDGHRPPKGCRGGAVILPLQTQTLASSRSLSSRDASKQYTGEQLSPYRLYTKPTLHAKDLPVWDHNHIQTA